MIFGATYIEIEFLEAFSDFLEIHFFKTEIKT
jgi:hypothetical protein